MSDEESVRPSNHPSRPHAARPVGGVALIAAIPGAIVGIFVGILFLRPVDQFGRLLLFGGGGAMVGGFTAYFAVYMVRRLLGRQAVWILGETISGGLIGLIVGLGLMDVWDAGWTLLLCPLGAAASGLWARRQARRPIREAESGTSPDQTD